MLPVPDWRTFNSPDQAARLAKALTFPLCLRPRSGQGGVEVADEAALTAALATFKGGGILEALGPGADVRLRIEAGRSDGSGDAHLDNLRLAEIAVRAAGLRDAYVIYRAADPSVSWRAAAGVFRQLTPIAPTPPPSQPTFSRTPGALLKDLFLPGADGRIPTAGVTGSMGKTTTCGMTAAILARAGLTVARTATQGVWLGADQIASGDKAGGRRAAGLLFDPAVQAGVFELSRGGLIKRGMSLDAVDVGVVLGVQDNHVGIDGVSTREDLAAVKSLVVRHARKLAILNADDPLCLKMREVVTAERLCLVSTAPENPALDVHAAAGGMTARLVQAGERHDLAEIRLFEGGALVGAMTAAEIPASMGGLFTPFLISALYATAISHGLGIGFDTIRSGLSGFESNVTTNPNRMNTMEGLPFKLWATWAEGPAAFAALAQLASRIPARRKTFMLSMMGNRPDLFLRETAGAAAAAGGFDDFICSDAVELRGRPPGEVAQLLATGLRDQGVSDDRITVVSHHSDAIAAVVSRIQPDDLLIVVSQRAGTGHLFRALEPMKIPPSS
jgi:cyanophycin synthetase